MKRREFLQSAAIAAAALTSPGWCTPAAPGPFKPTWESLRAHPAADWLLDAKFGIYAHWGVYSVPAFETEWYAQRMHNPKTAVYKHHLETYGPLDKFGYKDFIPRFQAEKFDPDAWAALVEASGARYAGMAVVHHDGFLLWDSKVSRWNSKQMGPRRDLFGDYAAALRRRGLKVIATEHHLRTFNWYVPGLNWDTPPEEAAAVIRRVKAQGWDLADPRYGDLYWNSAAGCRLQDFLKAWQAKVREVIDRYQPDVLWFDGGMFRDQRSESLVLDLLCHYHNQGARWGKPVEVLNKLPGTMKFNFDENYGMLTYEEGRDRPAAPPRPWIDDMKISDKAWCYIEGQQYKTSDEILDGLIDRVARGGGLLLNLSPRADGTIPEPQQRALRETGAWLKVNGEAIYGTRPWKTAAEGDEQKLRTAGRHPQWKFAQCGAADVRFTARKDGSALYVLALGVPRRPLRVAALGESAPLLEKPIAKIELLGGNEPVQWKREPGALVIQPPQAAPCPQAVAWRVSL